MGVYTYIRLYANQGEGLQVDVTVSESTCDWITHPENVLSATVIYPSLRSECRFLLEPATHITGQTKTLVPSLYNTRSKWGGPNTFALLCRAFAKVIDYFLSGLGSPINLILLELKSFHALSILHIGNERF